MSRVGGQGGDESAAIAMSVTHGSGITQVHLNFMDAIFRLRNSPLARRKRETPG